VSVGDPAGVGPVVALAAAARFPDEAFVLFGDADALARRAKAMGSSCVVVEDLDEAPADGLVIVDAGRCPEDLTQAHVASERGGRVQLESLEAAARFVAAGSARALVTGPTSKRAISLTGTRFRGQTEHLARLSGLSDDEVTMLFLGERLRTGLVTTHHAVRDVPDLLSPPRVARTCRHLAEAIIRSGERAPRIAVASLNPHAGEGGLFGDEESRVLVPGIAEAKAAEPFASGEASLEGPLGAETAFRHAVDGQVSGVVAMMHDQATIAAKLVDWGKSVNVTWGLPFVRTSVDHGVAYDAAARGEADPEGMVAAIRMAQRLTRRGPGVR
jgi:4-hydroxythreonine-4-phosphate dehydrogenase